MHICKVIWNIFERDQKMRFLNSVTVSKNLKRGTISDFLTSIVAKHQKYWRETLRRNWKFFGKSLTMPKTERGTFWIFQHPFCCKIIKKNRTGDPLETLKLFSEKNWKRGLFSLARYWMLRWKKGQSFLILSARPKGSRWHHKGL